METNGTLHRPANVDSGELKWSLLTACHEFVVRCQETLPILADAIGVAPGEVFYAWTLRREWLLEHHGQHGRIEDTGWNYFFHGAECDLTNDDGRVLRLDFGPGGRVDSFTSWGVLQYIVTSVEPWPEFSDLKAVLVRRDKDPGQSVGDTKVMRSLWNQLDALGAFEPAAPDLVEFELRHTTTGPDGIRRVAFPPGTSEQASIDCMVAKRTVLSPIGHRLLQDHAVALPAGTLR